MEKSKKVFYGWIVVAGGFVLMAVLHSMLQTCFSLFVVPVTTDMQISRSAFGICNTVIMVVTMLLSPYMGRWLAGKNTRGIFTGCVVGLGLSYASYSLAQATWHFYVSAALVGIFSCGAIVLPLSIIITNWFHKARGTAISIALAGSGIGGAIISPILTHFIQTDGWRSSFVIFGIVMIVIEVPVAFLIMRPRPQEMGLAPYGSAEAGSAGATAAAAKNTETDLPLHELKKHAFFWMYWLGMFILGLVGFGSLGQLAASLTDSYGQGFSAMIISFFLLLLTPAKISLGWVYDKIGPKFGTVYVMGAFAVALAMLLITNSTNLAWVMAVFYAIGICSGTVTPPVVTAATFGSKYYGEIYGFINFAVMAGGALGAPVVAAVYDVTGSYAGAWVSCSVLCIFSIALLVQADILCRRMVAARRA
jgi:Sugar phosphate permease